ncbi:MAG: hypothetical protein J6K33_07310, partial [Alistipes sp.]|nr:hypothetical protein [Alistipes sp.]
CEGFSSLQLGKVSKLTLLSLCSVGYACPQNAHLRQVNSAFSGFASLKIHLFIQPPNKMWVTI